MICQENSLSHSPWRNFSPNCYILTTFVNYGTYFHLLQQFVGTQRIFAILKKKQMKFNFNFFFINLFTSKLVSAFNIIKISIDHKKTLAVYKLVILEGIKVTCIAEKYTVHGSLLCTCIFLYGSLTS